MKDKIISVRIMPNGYGKASEEVRNYILNLHDEIIKLQIENERIEEEWKSKLDDVSMLTSRISKAIEYIDEMCKFGDKYSCYGDDLHPEYIIKILQGSNDNEQ